MLVFDSDDREAETDLLFPASAVKPSSIRRLRKDCGGLIFMAIGHEVGEQFGLPFLQDLHTTEEAMNSFPVLKELQTTDLQYDSRSAFTLSLNHRETFTGITDADRALTASNFSALVQSLGNRGAEKKEWREDLGKQFRTPGHVPLCREAKGGLGARQGHTELAVSIARLAELDPCVLGAEMLQQDGDKALLVEEAKKYGKKHGIPFVSGKELLNAYKSCYP